MLTDIKDWGMLSYKIEEGRDNYNKNIYRVLGINNEYTGEWHKSKKICDEEYNHLVNLSIEKIRQKEN